MVTYISLVITTLFWGGTFIAGRTLAGSVPPANAAFLRFAIATLVLAVLARLIDGKITIPPRSQWFSLLLLGMTGVFSYNILFFSGLQHIEAGRASLIIALNPLAITLAAVVFLGERLTMKQSAGILVSLIGALFVISNGHPSAILSGGFGKGEASILGCVASWTAYSIIGRSVLRSVSPPAAVLYSSLIGSLLLFPLVLMNNSFTQTLSYSIYDWTSLTFLGILGTAVGFSLYYGAIKKIGASRCSVFINLVPFFSILLSWFILNESMKLSVLAGGLILLTGVYLTNSSQGK
jgi:drug/metabolite transporter (DMT)-like permease